MKSIALLALFAVVCLVGCPTPTPVNPGPDAADAVAPPQPIPSAPDASQSIVDAAPMPVAEAGGSACQLACANLRSFGCKEGDPTGKGDGECEKVCDHTSTGAFSIKPDCLAAAKSAAAVRACGTVRCLQSDAGK